MPRLSFDKNVPITEQRLRVALSKVVRKHGKRHRTKRRSVKLKARKKQQATHKIAVAKKGRTRYIAAVRAYWAGERDEHP